MERKRYSDLELQEFKAVILKNIEFTKFSLGDLKSSLNHEGENGTNDTSPTFKVLEEGNETMTKEQKAKEAIRLENFLNLLKLALIRIENKTYGICRETGELISKERLMAVPHATLSITAKLQKTQPC